MRKLSFDAPQNTLHQLFYATFTHERKQQLKQCLCEALFYPGDAQWLAEQLEDIYSQSSHSGTIAVSHTEDGQVHITQQERTITLEWRSFWQERGGPNRSVDALTKLLNA